MFLINKTLLVFFVLIVCYVASYSQELQQIDNVVEDLVEHFLDNQDETPDIDALYEKLIDLHENPVNLNSATDEELKQIPFFSDYQVYSLKEYIKNYGEFLSIYELPLVFGFSESFVQLIEPFIRIEGGIVQKPKVRAKHEMLIRSQRILEEQLGYTNKEGQKYLGSPYKIYSRYRVKQDNFFSIGLTAEKDPGEYFFNDSLGNHVDYYSAHVSFENIGFIEQIVLGDFNASFGQGLVLWTNFSSGKSSYATNINRYATKITPYISTEENLFFRGVGTTLKLGDSFRASMLYSHKKIDGNIGNPDKSISNKHVFSSFQTSGYHNTTSLLNDKDAVTENLFGINIESILKIGVIGVTAISHHFDAYFLKEEKAYNNFHFEGEEYQTGSFYYRLHNKKITFFGENSLQGFKNFALLNGVDYFVHPQLSLSLLHRYFDPGYFSLYSDAFSESGKTQNENGTYLGLKFFPLPSISVNGYFDMYQYPWLRYLVDAPSSGRDYFAEFAYSISSRSNISIRYKNEQKDRNITFENGSKTSGLAKETLSKTRINFVFAPSESFSLKSRLEFSSYSLQQEKENGALFYQDINYYPVEKPYAINLRLAFFNTDGYKSRVYAYENDLLYTFNIPSYFYKGTRFYVNFRYKISKKISVYLKYARSNYKDIESIGSGLNEIQGQKKTEIKAQFRLKF